MDDSTIPDPAPDSQPADERASAAELEAAGQSAMFASDDEAAPQPTPQSSAKPTPAPTPAETNQPYRVLARKYRPQTFSELIGQEPMVRTLGNAIARDRLAHAFLMTGVRGVGKTSTARLIAKSLNCIGPDGQGGPTIDPCGVCEPCVAIAEGRHMDVIEMDAASNTGVDDVREIIEAVRYAAVSARYKIYIIDEVHMLSRNAFNALLKTLEEPPAHVKFLFATTEVDKLPVTVLSRTQRFDLRRIPADMLQDHFAHICTLENVAAEDEAMHMIAAAAEGSVRDGLSILDQAIAHADMEADGSGGTVTAGRVRDMLGLADKGAQRRLLGFMLGRRAEGRAGGGGRSIRTWGRAAGADAIADGYRASHYRDADIGRRTIRRRVRKNNSPCANGRAAVRSATAPHVAALAEGVRRSPRRPRPAGQRADGAAADRPRRRHAGPRNAGAPDRGSGERRRCNGVRRQFGIATDHADGRNADMG